MCKTIKYPEVWKPSLYMFISLALNISTHEGHFYWYTDPTAGPAFSQVGCTILKKLFLKILIERIKIVVKQFGSYID